MTTQQPFHHSADPLSENSRISRNFGEWVCGLTQTTSGNHYARTYKPAQPASNNRLTALKLVAQGHCTTKRSIALGSKQCIASLSSALPPYLVHCCHT